MGQSVVQQALGLQALPCWPKPWCTLPLPSLLTEERALAPPLCSFRLQVHMQASLRRSMALSLTEGAGRPCTLTEICNDGLHAGLSHALRAYPGAVKGYFRVLQRVGFRQMSSTMQVWSALMPRKPTCVTVDQQLAPPIDLSPLTPLCFPSPSCLLILLSVATAAVPGTAAL